MTASTRPSDPGGTGWWVRPRSCGRSSRPPGRSSKPPAGRVKPPRHRGSKAYTLALWADLCSHVAVSPRGCPDPLDLEGGHMAHVIKGLRAWLVSPAAHRVAFA